MEPAMALVAIEPEEKRDYNPFRKNITIPS
jgi:hypothetical protein